MSLLFFFAKPCLQLICYRVSSLGKHAGYDFLAQRTMSRFRRPVTQTVFLIGAKYINARCVCHTSSLAKTTQRGPEYYAGVSHSIGV